MDITAAVKTNWDLIPELNLFYLFVVAFSKVPLISVESVVLRMVFKEVLSGFDPCYIVLFSEYCLKKFSVCVCVCAWTCVCVCVYKVLAINFYETEMMLEEGQDSLRSSVDMKLISKSV
jgi:hypothetical protein